MIPSACRRAKSIAGTRRSAWDDPDRAPLRGVLLLELFRRHRHRHAAGLNRPARDILGKCVPVMPPPQRCRPCSRRLRGVAAPNVVAGLDCRRRDTAQQLHPAAVAAIVRALRQVGEDYAGRLFAIETAIAYGLWPAVKKKPPRRCRVRPRPSSRCFGRARRLQEYRGGLPRRSQEPRGFFGTAQAEARDRQCRCAARLPSSTISA